MLSINWAITHSIRAFDVLASSTFTSSRVEMSSPGEINPPISTIPSPLVTQSSLSSSSNALLSNE